MRQATTSASHSSALAKKGRWPLALDDNVPLRAPFGPLIDSISIRKKKQLANRSFALVARLCDGVVSSRSGCGWEVVSFQFFHHLYQAHHVIPSTVNSDSGP